MKTKKIFTYIILLFTTAWYTSCKKQDAFLATKPNEALAIPSTLADLQSLLQNEGLFNINDPALGEIASDDYYVPATTLSSRTTIEMNGYIWAKQVYDAGADISDWNLPYQQVYNANTVIEYLSQIPYSANQQVLADQIKGTALFFRSIAFYNLVQTFALPYDVTTATTDLGIPLRLSSNLNIKSVRATEQQCYDQIILDLQTALALLPVTPAYKTLPSQPAANALLARIYLAMGNYAKSFQYADDCLSSYKTLIDYNTVIPAKTSLLSTSYLAEDIFHSRLNGYSINQPYSKSLVDTLLFQSYTSNDLRKTIFFTPVKGVYYFRGTYDTKGYCYSGLATDEIYLIRAECYARSSNVSAAMADLNTLLITRWKTGTFVPYTATSADDALKQILTERKKELLYRGLRWTDLRRLNKDSRFAITLTRNLSGTIYTLPPNDVRYAWPIPNNEIQLSGIQQNAR